MYVYTHTQFQVMEECGMSWTMLAVPFALGVTVKATHGALPVTWEWMLFENWGTGKVSEF